MSNPPPPGRGVGLHLAGRDVQLVDPISVRLRAQPGSILLEVLPPAAVKDLRFVLLPSKGHPAEVVVARVIDLHPEDVGKMVVGQLVAVAAGLPNFIPVRHEGRELALTSPSNILLTLEEGDL
jgi:hypothetical protein